jgi:hypothetical protein
VWLPGVGTPVRISILPSTGVRWVPDGAQLPPPVFVQPPLALASFLPHFPLRAPAQRRAHRPSSAHSGSDGEFGPRDISLDEDFADLHLAPGADDDGFRGRAAALMGEDLEDSDEW